VNGLGQLYENVFAEFITDEGKQVLELVEDLLVSIIDFDSTKAFISGILG
jgi:hypothetical protein